LTPRRHLSDAPARVRARYSGWKRKAEASAESEPSLAPEQQLGCRQGGDVGKKRNAKNVVETTGLQRDVSGL
jgi:hypothetical protein